MVVENTRAELAERFLGGCEWGGARCWLLAGDASFRKYWRVALGNRQAVLMDAPPPEDVVPFVRVARHLGALGYSVPRILAADREQGFLLLEDLGDATYTRLLREGMDARLLYRLATDALIDLHHRPAGAAVPAGTPLYTDDLLQAEAALMIDWYLPAVTDRPVTDAIRLYWTEIWGELLPLVRGVPESLVLRDFHVDNLLHLSDRDGVGACGLLDFQDAVVGPVAYDLMSLLEDARRDVAPALRDEMVNRYLDANPAIDRAAFETAWNVLAAQRHAKVIGIFARLAARDGKPRYLDHIPRVWRLLEAAMAREPALTHLEDWLLMTLPPAERGIPVIGGAA